MLATEILIWNDVKDEKGGCYLSALLLVDYCFAGGVAHIAAVEDDWGMTFEKKFASAVLYGT